MASPAQELHTARELALRASAALATAMGTVRIYTAPPTNVSPPYVIHGEDSNAPYIGDCADEAEINATVHWWSKPETPDKQVQARAIGAAIVAALTTPLALPSHEIVEWECEAEDYRTDPSGDTHGTARFRYLITEIISA